MFRRKPSSTSVLAFMSLLLIGSLAQAEAPKSYEIAGVTRIKQMTNYCGPATLTAVLRFYGDDTTQEAVGKCVYDQSSCATNGADMLLYARDKGYAAYSWNTSIKDIKRIISSGFPVIVLQQNSIVDMSGHYRVITGYDDKKSRFSVVDPYYDNITQLSYAECDRLWRSMGYWALLIVPKAKDCFKTEMDARNPVVHMDLSYAEYKRKSYDEALKEARTALNLEPGNSYAQSMVNKIRMAMGAGTMKREAKAEEKQQDN